jgi:protein phosphatase
MGGHAAGEVASKLCLQTFASHLLTAIQDWLNFSEPNWQEALKAAFVEANRQVFAEAQAMRNNMGTTLTAAVLCGNKVVFANVGDSRGYLLQSGKLTQITKDHSLVQQYVDAGLLTPEQARWHPQRNIITQAIGIEPTVQVDTFEVTLQRGDLVLLCSDGLVDMIDDSEIERVLLSEPNLPSAVQTLIRLANEAGGDDNITVIVAKVM